MTMTTRADAAAICAAAGLEDVASLEELFDRARSNRLGTDIALALALARYIREIEAIEGAVGRCRRIACETSP
jgi:hypothetical protein